MKVIWLLVSGCLAVGASHAQRYTKTDNGIRAEVNEINIEVRWYSPTIVRIIKTPAGHSYSGESLSVVAKPERVTMDVREDGEMVVMGCGGLRVGVNMQTGKVVFDDVTGGPLLTEKDYGTQFSSLSGVDAPSYDVRQAFMLDKQEHIYGLGQQQNGRLDQRGQWINLRQDNMKICIPFFQSTKGYGLFWDNYSPTHFTDNPQETAFESEVGD